MSDDHGVHAANATPLTPSKKQVKSGVLWITAGFGATQVLRFGSSIALAALLDPRAFGLLALTFVFITALHLFSDLGIRVSIIQNPRGNEQVFLDTAWTIQVIRGFLIWLGTVALAWPAAFWRPKPEPDLLWLLPVIGLTAIIEGFISTNMHLLYRHLHQKKAALIDIVSTAAGIAVMLVWARFHPGLAALAAGPLVNSSVQLLLSYMLPGPRNHLRRDREAAREIVHFGRWIFLSTFFTFLADQSDRVVIGMFSMTILGVYHLANQIAMVPYALIGAVARQVVMPLYSRMIDAGHDIPDALRMVQVHIGAITALMIAGLIAVGPTLIRCLYDQRYQDATWILPLLSIMVMVQIFDNTASCLLLARGQSRAYAFSNATKVVCLVLFMPLGAWLDGVRGLIIALIIGEVGRYVYTGLVLRRDGFSIFRRDIVWAAQAIVLGFAVNRLAPTIGPALPETGRNWPVLLTRMGIETVLVVGIWSSVAAACWKIGLFKKRTGIQESSRF